MQLFSSARLTGTFNQSVSKSVFKAILLLMKFVSEVGKSSLLRPYSVQDGYTQYTHTLYRSRVLEYGIKSYLSFVFNFKVNFLKSHL